MLRAALARIAGSQGHSALWAQRCCGHSCPTMHYTNARARARLLCRGRERGGRRQLRVARALLRGLRLPRAAVTPGRRGCWPADQDRAAERRDRRQTRRACDHCLCGLCKGGHLGGQPVQLALRILAVRAQPAAVPRQAVRRRLPATPRVNKGRRRAESAVSAPRCVSMPACQQPDVRHTEPRRTASRSTAPTPARPTAQLSRPPGGPRACSSAARACAAASSAAICVRSASAAAAAASAPARSASRRSSSGRLGAASAPGPGTAPVGAATPASSPNVSTDSL